MSNCAIVGINWGDEGKGRMVDLIASDYDIVCRYQGGNNAGHTIVNEYGKFALHLCSPTNNMFINRKPIGEPSGKSMPLNISVGKKES